jgi:AraC-like DNA-binding protein
MTQMAVAARKMTMATRMAGMSIGMTYRICVLLCLVERLGGYLKFNGVTATPNTIHMPVDDVYFHIRGREREVLGCTLPRRRFVETAAALRGVDPDRLALHERALELAPDASERLRTRLAATIDKILRTDPESTLRCPPFDLTNLVFELMLEAYLHARSEPMRKSGRVHNPGRIVRAAEARFAQAGGNPVSLADLCAAAGVGKTGLYQAFESFCGASPIAYFHKRRMSKARSTLLNSEAYRGAVKRAALEFGLTELGRFSRDYRRLFGESPSITLSRSVTA